MNTIPATKLLSRIHQLDVSKLTPDLHSLLQTISSLRLRLLSTTAVDVRVFHSLTLDETREAVADYYEAVIEAAKTQQTAERAKDDRVRDLMLIKSLAHLSTQFVHALFQVQAVDTSGLDEKQVLNCPDTCVRLALLSIRPALQ